MIRIIVTSVPVEDQGRALDFYTRVLGFRVRHDIDMGGPRWLTVVAPDDPDGVELLLEPMGHPAAAPYQKALKDSGVPWTALGVDDLDAEYARLTGLGVAFKAPPAAAGPVRVAMLDDTCGNFVQLVERS